MTCRIDRRVTEQGLVIHISGRIATEDLVVLRSELDLRHVVAIDLAEIELVHSDAVKLLARTEAEGVALRNCPPYIREWITRERARS